MGLLDTLSSFFVSEAYAEEPPADDESEPEQEEGESKAEGETEGEGEEEQDGDDAGADSSDDEDEEEEEEEEEPEDPMPKLQEECSKTPACAHAKDEFEECSHRVQRWNDADEEERKGLGPKEDCVEEFFEYTHCISQCAAPKLFKQLR